MFATRAVRHRVKVLAPFLFTSYLNMQTSIACVLGLVICHLVASAGQSCCFEQLVLNHWLKHHKVGIFVEKSNSQRLKKSKKFAFGNSQFTRQHNISLSGTINK